MNSTLIDLYASVSLLINCAARHILPIQVKFRWCLKYIFLRHCYVWCFVHWCLNEYAHMSWEASQVIGVIIFTRNVSFREYYVFVSNAAATAAAAAAAATSQFRCQRDNFWRIWTTLLKLDTCIPKWPIDLKWPEMRSKVNFGHPKWPTAAILSKISKKNKSCISIWNGKKCDRKWISDIQNGRRHTFCQKN